MAFVLDKSSPVCYNETSGFVLPFSTPALNFYHKLPTKGGKNAIKQTRQRRLWTYPLKSELVHTSMWLPRETRDWLAHAAAESHLSQALIVNTLVNYAKLRRYQGTPYEKQEWYKHAKRAYVQILDALP